MKKQIAALILAALPVFGFAATSVPLDHVQIDLKDKAALQDGLHTFVNYCMGCHSAQFQRYERVANDLGISEDDMISNLILTDAKFGDHMVSSMRVADAKAWLGLPPPDLTLVARVRGADWLYTYMRSFFVDEKRPWGVNNVIFDNVGMPNVLEPLQGIQKCVPAEGGPVKCKELTTVEGTGTLNKAEFDDKIKNLVTFLAYSADPNKLESHRIGIYVLIYLAILFVFAYLLKREYWKDVH